MLPPAAPPIAAAADDLASLVIKYLSNNGNFVITPCAVAAYPKEESLAEVPMYTSTLHSFFASDATIHKHSSLSISLLNIHE